MVRKSVRGWIALGLLGAALPVANGWGQETPAPPLAVQPAQPVPTITLPVRIALEGEGGPTETLALVQTTAESAPTGEYWIGIALGELPEVAKNQLHLEYGLVVEDVLPDSPAAKAQFKRHDVLIRAGDEPLKEPADILKAVETAQEQELTIFAYRDGKEATLKVTPVKRPKPEAVVEGVETTFNAQVPAGAIQRLEEALAQLKGKAGNEQLGIFFARPGVVAPGWSKQAGEFPKDMTVSITKEGDQPARIYVRKPGQKWDVTADKLMDLPEDVRVHVEQILSRTMHPALSARAQALVVGGGKVGPAAMPGVRVPTTVYTPTTASGAAPSPARMHAYLVDKQDGSDAKFDLILKKLEALDNSSIERLQDEVKKLRQELDELRNK